MNLEIWAHESHLQHNDDAAHRQCFSVALLTCGHLNRVFLESTQEERKYTDTIVQIFTNELSILYLCYTILSQAMYFHTDVHCLVYALT